VHVAVPPRHEENAVGGAGSVPQKDEVSFGLGCPALQVVPYQARLDGVAYLKGLLKPEFMVALGTMKLTEVATLLKE
jgi:hypothetical protein